MKALTLTDKGNRDQNEDLIIEEICKDGSYLFAIVDGMGGYSNGALAAHLIGESIITYLSRVENVDDYQVQKAVNKSSLLIRQKSRELSGNMGATIGGVLVKESNALFFWVGDVKVFHFRNNSLLFESSSHNLTNDLVNSGVITNYKTLSRYKHVVTRSINGEVSDSIAEFYRSEFILESDTIIVCSDGVHNLFESIQLENILKKYTTDVLLYMKKRLSVEALDNFSIGIISKETEGYEGVL